ncbi:MAG: DPP IV N-terminal domain-containing protein [Planctomycetota bacterium]
MSHSRHTHSLAVSLLLSLFAPALAQDRASPAEREALHYRYLQIRELVKDGVVEPHWMPDGDGFWFVRGAPAATAIIKVDPHANSMTPLLDTEKMRRCFESVLGHRPPYDGLPFADLSFIDAKTVRVTVEGKDFFIDLADQTVRAAPAVSEQEKKRTTPQHVRAGFAAGDADVMEVASPDGRAFLTVRDGNLWLRFARDGRSEQFTDDAVEDYEWDVQGARWAPDSLHVAALRSDTRNVPRLPVVHWLKTVEEVEFFPYTKAGGPLPRTELAIIDILRKEVTPVAETGLDDQFVFLIGWRKGSAEVLFLRVDRLAKRLELFAASAETGEARNLLTETSDTFLWGLKLYQIWQKLYTPVGNDGRFVWLSERDGWSHLYLYDAEGQPIAQLTKGPFPVLEVARIDEEGGWVYFTAHAEQHPYHTHLYRVNLQGAFFQRLTQAPGEHAPVISPSGRFFVDVHSAPSRPPVTELRKADGTLLRVIAESRLAALEELQWHPPEEFVATAADGRTTLYGALYKPYDFDPHRKYPVVDAIYNGPFITVVPKGFDGGMLSVQAQAFAQLGFIVLLVDGRGTTERGKTFQDVVYHAFGENEIPDHAAVLRELAVTRPTMDLDRVGIYGGSWGGYMTIRALVTHPDLYDVGVAINPVADLYDHAATPIEPYMGLPQQNREIYERASSIALADRLHGKLMLIHGTSDVNATFSATMKMVAALIEAGKPHDLVVLPEATHYPQGKNALYMWKALIRYFVEHLEPARETWVNDDVREGVPEPGSAGSR